MDGDKWAALTELKTLAQETQTTLKEHGDSLDVIMKMIAQLIELLAPKGEDGDITLEDLLAHMIKQAEEQIKIARDTLEAIGELRRLLPAEVAAAVKG